MTTDPHKDASQDDAAAIYQEVLDALSDALMQLDRPVLTSRVSFPFRMSTQAQEFVIESPEDWLDSAMRFGQNIRAMGVNHFIRLVTDAEFLSANYITGRHVTHTLRNAVAMVPSYECRTTLAKRDGVWRVTEMDTMIENTRWPIAAAKVTAGAVGNWHDHGDAADARRASASPIAIYQEFLDELSRLHLADDLEGWCACFDFPHSIHMDEVDTFIDHAEQIRPFFDMIRDQIDTHRIDRFERSARQAEFLSATQICGYHETNLYAGNTVALGPVASRIVLNRSGTEWRVASITNSLANTEFPYAHPEPSQVLVSLRDIQERTTRQ